MWIRALVLCVLCVWLCGCQRSLNDYDGTPLREVIETTLGCKQLFIYPEYGKNVYDQIIDKELVDWFEAKAMLRYEKTLGPQCYLYSLSYEAAQSKKIDAHEMPITRVTHLVYSPLNFLRHQNISIRYAADEPLVFEWIERVTVCLPKRLATKKNV